MKKKPAHETAVIGIRVPMDIKTSMEKIALAEERTVSQQVIFFLRRAIADWEYSEHLRALAPQPRPKPVDTVE